MARRYIDAHANATMINQHPWEAEMGIYRSGETWVQPAFTYDIATRNASAHELAEALVVPDYRGRQLTDENQNVGSAPLISNAFVRTFVQFGG